MTKPQLVAIVKTLQGILYVDHTGSEGVTGDGVAIPPHTDFWNHDKEWDSETLERLAEVLREHDLVPDRIMPATAAIHGRGD